jgi:hypothetical protein
VATSTRNSPSVASVGTSVPEQHPGMTAAFEHLKPHKMPATSDVPVGLAIAPSMTAIVIDRVCIVDPKIAAIIRDDAETIMASPVEPHAACPTHSKVITSMETRPLTASVPIVHIMFPASMVRAATIQVLAMAPLTKVEYIFHKESMAISDAIGIVATATCTRNHPPVAGVGTMIPEKHPSVATVLKHLKPYEMPPCTNVPSCDPAAPSVQAIVVDRVPVVEPEVASIIRDNLEVVITCPEKSHAACPTHSEVIVSVEP